MKRDMAKAATSQHRKYLTGKIFFWIAFVLLLVTVTVLGLFHTDAAVHERQIIRAAIAGEVKKPAVYSIPEGADLGMLIRLAGGLTLHANALHTNFETLIKNDSIYYISAGKKGTWNGNALADSINTYPLSNTGSTTLPLPNTAINNSVNSINVLYIGFPAVYLLISYYPEYGRVSITHVPHTAMLLNNDYRLIDIFFTLGIAPTLDILQKRLNYRIDYYLIQDRFSFIDMIDLVNGIEVNVDKPFSEDYNITEGKNNLDGFHAWEYIRFLDFKRIKLHHDKSGIKDNIREDNFTADAGNLETAYELRQHRQRVALNAIRKSFSSINPVKQTDILEQIIPTFETNIPANVILKLYDNLLNTPDFSYGNLPGYYETGNEGALFYYPDVPSFEMLKKKEIREYLTHKSRARKTIY